VYKKTAQNFFQQSDKKQKITPLHSNSEATLESRKQHDSTIYQKLLELFPVVFGYG